MGMSDSKSQRWFSLVQRELREYRVSLVWTPLATAALLSLLMLAGLFVANQFSYLGEVVLDAITQAPDTDGLNLNVQVSIDENGNRVTEITTQSTEANPSVAEPLRSDYQVAPAPELADEHFWQFSSDWRFNPATPVDAAGDAPDPPSDPIASLHPLLYGIHAIMLLVLLLVSVNYLQGCLFVDRKDRSILFWKSMPVSAWDEVLAKLSVALLVAPALFIVASVLTQWAMLLVALVLSSRVQVDALGVVLANVQIGRLLLDQVLGWLASALWVLPLYAWIMLASAGARRSPALLAATPLVVLALLEAVLLGSQFFVETVWARVPALAPEGASGGYFLRHLPWQGGGLFAVVAGLLVTGLLLWACVWLRRNRWEL
tara:strand:+ start:2315 stop:3436 length:1122 start_codon:yes stop_codon:yes gene_type:complete